MAELDVDIVAVEREIWSGKATFLFTRTTSGEIGILPRHIPLVAQLVDDAMVRVEREGEDDLRIAVDGGFMSVTDEGVIILAESAELESEIDADAAKQDSESDDRSDRRQGPRQASRAGSDRLEPPMSASMLIMAALVGVLLLVVIALCYRLWKLRQVGGTAAILRDFPAVGGQGWRHGVMRYRGGEAGLLPAVQSAVVARSPAEPSRARDRVAALTSRRRVRHHDRRDRDPRTARHQPGTRARL